MAKIRINFNLRNQKADKPTPVNIVMRWRNRKLVYPSGKSIEPKKWSTKLQRLKPGTTGKGKFDEALTESFTIIETQYDQFIEKYEREPTELELRSAIHDALNPPTKDNKPKTFIQFVERFIDESPNRITGKNGELQSRNTKKNYQSTLNHLKAFKEKNNLQIQEIDSTFYNQFAGYLTQKGLSANTVGKYLKTLKSFLFNAESDEKIAIDPFFRSRKCKVPSEETTAIYLNDDELNELFGLDLSSKPYLERARDLLVFHSRTGLRHSDWKKFSEITFDDDFIRIKTQKTKQVVTIPIHPTSRIIRSRYLGKYANGLPPALSNQKMNQYVKELAALAPSLQKPVIIYKTKGGRATEITKQKYECISTHTARRSFASNLYHDKCPIQSIMAITGHKTESSFRKYIRLDGEDHAKIIGMHMSKNAPMAVVK